MGMGRHEDKLRQPECDLGVGKRRISVQEGYRQFEKRDNGMTFTKTRERRFGMHIARTATIQSVSPRVVANQGVSAFPMTAIPAPRNLLLDDSIPWIRRVAYDMDKELEALSHCDLPHREWLAKTLESARPQMP